MMTTRFKLNDSVKVRNGVIAEDSNMDLSGRVGRISGWETEDLEEPLYYVYWDSVTLNELDFDSIKFYEENGVDWDFICLYESEIEVTAPRDKPSDVQTVIETIQEKLENRTNHNIF